MNAATLHTLSTDAPRNARTPDEIRSGGSLWGVVMPDPIETLSPDGLRAISGTPRLVVRSGVPANDAAGSFATWSGAGWQAFEDAVSSTLGTLRSLDPKCQLVIWPGSGSVLSDAISTLTFARKETGARLLADPVSWITETMTPDAEDHLTRFAQALSLCEAIDGVVVRPVPGAMEASEAERLLAPVTDPVTGRGGIVLGADAIG